MGQNVDNDMGPTLDNQGGTIIGWVYAVGRGIPTAHNASPAMTDAQIDTVLDDADGTEQEWLDAHPQPVRTWLQQRPAAKRARFKANCSALAAWR